MSENRIAGNEYRQINREFHSEAEPQVFGQETSDKKRDGGGGGGEQDFGHEYFQLCERLSEAALDQVVQNCQQVRRECDCDSDGHGIQGSDFQSDCQTGYGHESVDDHCAEHQIRATDALEKRAVI